MKPLHCPLSELALRKTHLIFVDELLVLCSGLNCYDKVVNI